MSALLRDHTGTVAVMDDILIFGKNKEEHDHNLRAIPTRQTDYKPLVPLIYTYDLDKVPLRCQRLLMCLMKFNAKVVHVLGKQLVVADMLSRNPLTDSGVPDTAEDVNAFVQAVMSTRSVTSDRLDSIRAATRQDVDLQRVASYIHEGWPSDMSLIPYSLHGFHAARAHLSEVNGLLLHDDRIIIPASQRKLGSPVT
ncbi:hypothetical protein SKAU_G00021480 [Synaphobranchus kaupii]|uniref:Reverse transcriptase domain-containing protein n=1 Tax=Synaphobranchus kaupii TaxID=118154 RepID=A0A9Q1GD53_SYNKA|nr:hypothetical protein SKAU_G00021480 [Synaphobranchus kaupii]